jgi:hypothetical protein
MQLLTKSKYMNGLQCTRLLWHSNKKRLPEITISDQHKFDQGHEFEEQVKKLYPDSTDLNGLGFKENLEKTKEAVENKNTIFEAGFLIDNLFVRSDLLIPNEDEWDLYEIKSSTEAKPQHLPDLAFQKYVLEKSGLKINKCFVIFINREYVKQGEINPEELINIEEVTEKINMHDIDKHIKQFKEVMNMKEYKDIPIGQHCNKPYPCPLKSQCWASLPKNHVLQLTNWRQYWHWFAEGIRDIEDLPEDEILKPKDQVIVEAIKENKEIISKEHIKHFLSSLNYPLYHFDFETFDTAIPIFDNSRPYQKMPFQYSLHIEQEDGSTEHNEFLSEGGDPRIAILKQMKEELGTKGDIVTYNKAFEIGVMRKLALDFPEDRDWLETIIDRVIDLADIFRNFYYYHPSQKGSYSIKKVLPAVTGKGYDELEIANGADASMLYFLSHITNKLDNKEEIRKNLLKYCKLDTEGMVWILQELRKV